jgi:hypothetical protein
VNLQRKFGPKNEEPGLMKSPKEKPIHTYPNPDCETCHGLGWRRIPGTTGNVGVEKCGCREPAPARNPAPPEEAEAES